jgi:heat shock protein HslJ
MTVARVVIFALLSAAIFTACNGAGGSEDALVGPVWNLVTLNEESLVPGTSITAEFSEDGSVTGSSGCNNYAATYEVDGDAINFDLSATAMTLMACPDPIMKQEAAYLAVLAAASTFEASEEEMVLFGPRGESIAVYEAVSQDLAGSSWEVVGYNNGQGGVVSVIIGTQITADFGEDGQLTGNAGCNDYFGPYETDGNKISMGPFGSGRMACSEPEGIMHQERQYLAALETADTYKIEGNSMNMRTADGATVANFQRVQP